MAHHPISRILGNHRTSRNQPDRRNPMGQLMCNIDHTDECQHAAEAEREIIIEALLQNWDYNPQQLVNLANVIELIESIN